MVKRFKVSSELLFQEHKKDSLMTLGANLVLYAKMFVEGIETFDLTFGTEYGLGTGNPLTTIIEVGCYKINVECLKNGGGRFNEEFSTEFVVAGLGVACNWIATGVITETGEEFYCSNHNHYKYIPILVEEPVFDSARVTSFSINLQDKNNDNLWFTVEITLSDGSTSETTYYQTVNGGQEGSKTFGFEDFSVFVRWNDNNTVTICEVI